MLPSLQVLGLQSTSAEAFEEEYRVLPLRIYGLSPEINVVAFTDRYVRYTLYSPFAALGTR